MMTGIGKITKEDLRMLGFKPIGLDVWCISFDDTFNIINVDISEPEAVHVSIECLNDSMHVPNAYALSDLVVLITLFGKYSEQQEKEATNG
ncbi:hypothetical protein [Arcticibacter sp.]|uniref:hypothetical protein n=1 Tax=Arcticibacter sp. TaxID=1872630 RepID=UPI003890E8F8